MSTGSGPSLLWTDSLTNEFTGNSESKDSTTSRKPSQQPQHAQQPCQAAPTPSIETKQIEINENDLHVIVVVVLIVLSHVHVK